MNLVFPLQESLAFEDRSLWEAVVSLGGKVVLLGDGDPHHVFESNPIRFASMPNSVNALQRLLEAEGMPLDETVFVASNPSQAMLARSARLKIGGIGNRVLDLIPDEHWADVESAIQWFGRHSQLSKRAWPIATVGGLVFAPDQTALFVRTAKWSGTWGVPGGKIDYGETHLAAFAREIQEETGLVVEEPELILVQDAIEEPEFFRPRHFLLLNFTAKCQTKEIRLNHESLEAGWFPLQNSLELVLNRPTRILVEHLLRR